VRRKLADLVTGAIAALVVFIAVPTVLVTQVGLPLPRHWDAASLLAAPGLFDLLAVVAWISWVACCWPLLRSVVARVRRRDTVADDGARLTERLAARIAAAILVVTPVTLTLGTIAGAAPAPRPPVVQSAPAPTGSAVVAAGAVSSPGAPPSPPAPTAPPLAQPGPSATSTAVAPIPSSCTVRPGDSLWTIAERYLGDGAEWSAIASLNLGRIMDDGRRFLDPSLIYAGWVIQLPPPVGTSAADPAPAAPVQSATPAPSDPAPPALSPPADEPPAAAERVLPPPGAAQRSPTRGPGPTAPVVDRRPDAAGPRFPRPARRPPPMALPELAVLGVGVVVAAGLARRVRRGRLRKSAAAPPPRPGFGGASGGASVDVATLLGPFDGSPLLEWVELANRYLGASLDAGDGGLDPPAVELIRVGADGVEVRLARPVAWAPGGWQLRHDGRVWFLPGATDPRHLQAARAHSPWLPCLVPVGDDDDGTWLLPVEPGACLPVIGAEADAMVAAMRRAAASWSWAEQLVVTDDPAVAEREVQLIGQLAPGSERLRVLFIGDPRDLDDQVQRRCGVLTTLPLPATGLTVAVDARGASLHPIGVLVRPHLLDGRHRAGVDELIDEWVDTDEAPGPSARGGDPGAPVQPGPGNSEHDDPVGASLAPGPVEVRLLTAIPRIDGLEFPLEPKRARRAVELVAYLVVHHPDPVTSERLRTRVLGSADADAAAKTLFNTAGAARRALGRDQRGEPCLPIGTKSGHYRISDSVTADAARALALVGRARAVEDPDEAMALYRAALDLVEGVPLDGTLSGYAWWSAEGHERRVADALVDGACELSRLARGQGRLELARWALERARLVDPYSEALTRAAMQVAAAGGDADRLRREWVECQRRVDELDPGSMPSERTERLYAELRGAPE